MKVWKTLVKMTPAAKGNLSLSQSSSASKRPNVQRKSSASLRARPPTAFENLNMSRRRPRLQISRLKVLNLWLQVRFPGNVMAGRAPGTSLAWGLTIRKEYTSHRRYSLLSQQLTKTSTPAVSTPNCHQRL